MTEAGNEKQASADAVDTTVSPSHEHVVVENDPAPQAKAWMYKTTQIGPIKVPGYASPPAQLALVAFVCFLCPGMFNAVNGLGAGGQVDPYDINNANTAVYATFSVVGFFAGSIANRIGMRLTLGLGGFGYFLYVASILSYNHNRNAGFLIFAGAILGVCAALLWTAQGAVMMSYPAEKSKGKYISWFWMIFNLGAVIGSLVSPKNILVTKRLLTIKIPLGLNMNSEAGAVNDGTYIAFMVLMAIGSVLAFSLVDSKHVQRADGSRVVVMKNPTWKSEILGLFEVLKTDWYIICLFPMFLSSNWFYTYQFQDVNAAYFNIRTRALNNTLYWISQIIGAYIMGYGLDVNIRRTTRAKALWVILLILIMAVWGGGYTFQRRYTRPQATAKTFEKMDFKDPGYVGPMVMYMFYGLYDAMWQTSVYW